MDHDTLTFYHGGVLRRGWRWRYQAQGNGLKMANGSEAYVDLPTALRGALRVCHLPNPFASSELVHVDTLITRGDDTEVMIRFR